jgi:hypothetical protein
MAVFRGLLVVFGVAVVVLVGLYLIGGNRKYLAWAGRLFAATLGAALFFFAVLIVQKLI